MVTARELYILQDRIKSADKSALSEMYAKLCELALKYVGKECKIILTDAERQQKAHDAATYIIEQYLKRPDFAIKNSFSGYIYKRVQYELYKTQHRACDKIVVYTDKLPDGKQKKKYKYVVHDAATDTTEIYENGAALYMNPVFKNLRKKRLAECIRTGRKWKHFYFDLLEE